MRSLWARPVISFVFSVPIATLGGLIGLGGAEFRLPVLAGILRYPPREAIPLNLLVSFVTIAFSFGARSQTLSLSPIVPLIPTMLALIVGALVAAYVGTSLFHRLPDYWLFRTILALLLIIGVALIGEGLVTQESGALLPHQDVVKVGAGLLFGASIGLVSSMLGVAGGEVIIPTLVFAYGVDIKTAGTASLLISLPTVALGIARYAQRGAYRRQALIDTVAPMAVGSIGGALLGGVLAGVVASSLLKIGLGIILILSSWRTFKHRPGAPRNSQT